MLIPHWTYRYRLTVEVERDGRLYSGSSVIEVRREKGINGIGGEVMGEAVAVDLGRGDILFALLQDARGESTWAYSVVHKAFADRLGTADMVSGPALTQLMHLTGAAATLSPSYYPMLVRFRDLHDPTTVEAVDPDDLAKTFGNKTTLRRITIQLTSESRTHALQGRLPWLSKYWNTYFNGERFEDLVDRDLAAHLGSGSFVTER